MDKEREGQLNRELGAVGAQPGNLDPRADQTGFAGRKVVLEAAAVPVAERGGNDHVGQNPANDVVPRMPEHLLSRRVKLGDPAAVVHGDNRVLG